MPSVRSLTFPEALRFRAERGVSEAVVRAARQQRVSTSEYVRKAVRAQLASEGIKLPPISDDDGPAPSGSAVALKKVA